MIRIFWVWWRGWMIGWNKYWMKVSILQMIGLLVKISAHTNWDRTLWKPLLGRREKERENKVGWDVGSRYDILSFRQSSSMNQESLNLSQLPSPDEGLVLWTKSPCKISHQPKPTRTDPNQTMIRGLVRDHLQGLETLEEGVTCCVRGLARCCAIGRIQTI